MLAQGLHARKHYRPTRKHHRRIDPQPETLLTDEDTVAWLSRNTHGRPSPERQGRRSTHTKTGNERMGLGSDIQQTQQAATPYSQAAALLDRLPVGVIVFNARLKVAFANLTARSWFTPQASVVDLLKRVAVERHAFDWQSILRAQLREKNIQRFAGSYQRADGAPSQQLEITLSNGQLQDGGEVYGFVTVCDVTEQHSPAQRSGTLERMAAIGQVAAKVAHELNNPLDGVSRYAGLARRRLGEQADAKTLDYLDRIQEGVRRMTGIVRDLLEFSRTHTNVDRPATVHALLEDAIESSTAHAPDVRVELRVDENVTSSPFANGDGLLQVFCNLLKNAVDALDGEGRIDVSVAQTDQWLRIRFEDDGPGVGDDPEKLFKAFYTTKLNGAGTGLGLAVCRELIHTRGGRISAANRHEGGACFTIDLPAPIAKPTTTSEEGAADD